MRPPLGGPDLTVIVPVFDRIELLRRAIATIASQSDSVAVVVVDDGSSTEVAAAVDELATDGSPVAVIHQPNRGPAAARNAGLKVASSRFVMFLDSDDELAEGAFAVLD